MTEKNTTEIFSGKLLRLRKQRGLSQYDLAEMTGIPRRMISHYETKGILPPAERLDLLAQALNVSVSELFEPATHKKIDTVDLTGIDPRSVKKLKDILSLPPNDRNVLYRILNELLRKNQLEKDRKN